MGIEEEFLVVDAASGRCVSAQPLIEGGGDDLVSELNDCCVEWNSPIFTEAAAMLGAAVSVRRDLVRRAEASDRRVLGVGMHPNDDVGATIAPDDRHERLARRYPWASVNNVVYGMHVHVGMPSLDEAARVSDLMRPLIPLLVAAGANSPIRGLEPVGAVSTRLLLSPLFPRTGPPPRFGGQAGLDDYIQRMAALGVIRDYRDCWWLVRPHPKFGTLEFRMFDAQSDPVQSVRLACLVRLLAETSRRNGALMPDAEDDVIIEEIVTAARDGFAGTMFNGAHNGRRIGDVLIDVVGPVLDGHPDAEFLQPLLAEAARFEATRSVEDFLRQADLAAHV
ncbi:MAG: Enzymatic protein of unknown function [Thermoleophilia bacterium]|nr:Enzymatic protein of unknown function [Thermoleophilia bacterium]